MQALLESDPVITDDDDFDDLVHLTCACNNRSKALCGAFIGPDDPMVEDPPEEDICVVCDDLNAGPCPFCGAD